jgi:hypothetical protein
VYSRILKSYTTSGRYAGNIFLIDLPFIVDSIMDHGKRKKKKEKEKNISRQY